jgi:hypothetical protein
MLPLAALSDMRLQRLHFDSVGDNKYESIRKEVFVALLDVIIRYLSGGTEGSREKSQSLLGLST